MRKRLVDDVEDKIIEMIMIRQHDGESSIGDYVFNEGELAEKFSVSRSTVREAVRSLEVRGFVERVHGIGIRLIDKGMTVVTQSFSDMFMRGEADYAELLEVRRIIEPQAVRLAALRATADELGAMMNSIRAMADEAISYQEYVEADLLFHSLIVKATKNLSLMALVKSYEFIIKNLILASTSPNFRPETVAGFHRKVYDHILNRDPDGAEMAMKEHLSATESNVKNLHIGKLIDFPKSVV